MQKLMMLGASETEVFSVPAGKELTLMRLEFTNTDTSPRYLTINRYDKGDVLGTPSTKNKDVQSLPLYPNNKYYLDTGDTMCLTDGFSIQAKCDVADKISVLMVCKATPRMAQFE